MDAGQGAMSDQAAGQDPFNNPGVIGDGYEFGNSRYEVYFEIEIYKFDFCTTFFSHFQLSVISGRPRTFMKLCKSTF